MENRTRYSENLSKRL